MQIWVIVLQLVIIFLTILNLTYWGCFIMVINKLLILELSKLEPFTLCNYQIWQQNSCLFLETIAIVWVLTKLRPSKPENQHELVRPRWVNATWDTLDLLCKNYILNTLKNVIYDVYCKMRRAKKYMRCTH